MELRDAGGSTRKAVVESVSYTEYEEFLNQAAERPRTRETKVGFLDSGAIAHFIYPAFQMSDAEKQRVDATFKEIKTRGSRDLVLDIRGNGGGNSNMGEHISPYLPTSARPMAAVMRGKVVTRHRRAWRSKTRSFLHGPRLAPGR